MNILITGGAGFVGSNLTRLLLDQYPDASVTIVDNYLSAEPFNIPESSRIRVIKGSIADDQVLAQVHDEYQYIFYLATYHGNQSSIHDPIQDHENNTLTTLKLLEHIKSFENLDKIVYSSAGCSVAKKTFDQAVASKETETVSLEMDSPYSISKIIGEFYSKYYFKEHKTPVVRARFQNVYGPHEVLGAGRWRGTPATIWRNVVPTFIYKALKGMPIPLENGGIATRDFIYVEDICRGLLACATLGKPGDVYNLASGVETSIKDLALLINEYTGNGSAIQELPKRSWDTSGKRFGATEKSEEELMFKVQTNLQEGLQRTIDWTRENIDLIDETIAKHKQFLAVK